MKVSVWKRAARVADVGDVQRPGIETAEVKRRFGSMAAIRELHEMKNEIRALRNEPALSLDDYMAELAGKL